MRSIGFALIVVCLTVTPLFAKPPTTAPASQLTRTIALQVVDEATKAPLPGASVSLWYDGAPARPEKREADANGQVRVELGAENWGFTARAIAPQHVQIDVSWSSDGFAPAPPAEQVTIALPRGVRIGGVVQDESGRPVADASVMLNLWPRSFKGAYPGEPYVNMAEHKVRTDRDGHWTCDNAPADADVNVITVEHPDFFPTQGFPKPDHDELVAGKATVTVKKGIELTGHVADDAGKPIAGAQVQHDPGERPPGPMRESAADGAFRFEQVRPGFCFLLVRAKGFAPQLLQPTVEPGKPLEVKMKRSKLVRGRVTDVKGNALPAARIRVNGIGKLEQSPLYAEGVDADGRFAVDADEAEPLTAFVDCDGFAAVSHVKLNADTEHGFKLSRPFKIFGEVLDADTKKPVEHCSIDEAVDGPADEPVWSGGANRQTRNGRYLFSYFESRPYARMRFRAPGYEPVISQVFEYPEGTTRYDITMRRTGGDASAVIRGIVNTPDGKPARGVTVLLLGDSGSVRVQGTPSLHLSTSAPNVKTEDDGTFALDRPEGNFRVFAISDAGFVETDEMGLQPPTQLALEEWSRIAGEVHLGDQAGARQLVLVRPQRWGADEYPRIGFDWFIFTDAKGQFTVDHVPPGPVLIGRANPACNLEFSGSNEQQLVTVAPGETTTVSIGGSGRRVVGKLALPDSLKGASRLYGRLAELRSRELDENEQPKRFARFDLESDGSFHIDNVDPGEYVLVVTLREPPQVGEGIDSTPILGTARADVVIEPPKPGATTQPQTLPPIPVKLAK